MRVGKNQLNRKIFALNDFRGVDYASSPLEVKPYRATDMANLLLRDGMLKKRKGFKQLFHAKLTPTPSVGYSELQVKAFKCGQNDYGDVIVVQYYNASALTSTFVTYGKKSHNGGIEELHRRSIEAGGHTLATSAYSNGKLYLFCGYGLSMPNFTGILTTENGIDWNYINPYIPTTTVNVPINARYLPNDTTGDEGGWRVDDGIQYPYTSNESANILSSRVKNRMLFKEGWFDTVKLQNDPPFFKLDGKVPGVKVTAGESSYTEVKEGYADENNVPALYIPDTNGNYTEYGTFIREKIENIVDTNYGIYNVHCWYNEEAGVAVFYSGDQVSFGHDVVNNSVLAVLKKGKFKSMITSIGQYVSGTDYKEFILEYKNANLGITKDKISSASAATIFGVDGANDRVFVGNGNTVYFSENDMDFKPDPTYFPVDNFIVCGTSESRISAMMRVSDGSLAIFKDVSTYEDVSVYYTSGYYESVGVGEEWNEYQRAKFTVKAGDITRSGISARAIANLEGDNIFTSKEGVYGIQLSNNVASGERYARERSRVINPKITKLGLKNSKAIVYEDKYFLAVDNGEVYVADARYKFTLKGDQENTFNYEWFRLTGLYIKEWFIFEDKLHFIDEYGYVCEFTEGFADQYLFETDNGELAVRDDGTVIFPAEDLAVIKSSSYAVDDKGRTWEIMLTEDESALIVPEDIEIVSGALLKLWFCVPIAAYWQSAVLNLDNPMYRKNMWALSMTAAADNGGMINLGYKTRLNAVNNIEIEGVNAKNADDINFIGGIQTSLLTGQPHGFGMYTFDVGGYVGINTYRRRIFERDFVHIQLLFTSETVNNCVVSELDIEYAVSKKNIGVG